MNFRFNALRENIPALTRDDNAAKIRILKSAREYLVQLEEETEKILMDLELQRKRKDFLEMRFDQLRGSDCYDSNF